LPTDVDSGEIKADFKDGVLKIDIPKPEKQKPKQITIH
jgi:HSP20 family protein